MKMWTNVLAMTMAGALVAATAFAQGSGAGAGGNTTTPQMGTQQPKPSGMNTDMMKSTDTKAKAGDATKSDSAGAASPSTAPSVSPSMTGSDKSDMKADTSSRRASKGAGRGDVKAAQQALKDKGHDPGPVDGVMGPKTQAALHDFQKSSGIKESGRLDSETMAKLGVEGGTSSTGASAPSASPGASSGAGAGSDKK